MKVAVEVSLRDMEQDEKHASQLKKQATSLSCGQITSNPKPNKLL
jgi:hypothetical protein